MGYAFYLKDSSKKAYREAALILIAVCAGLKIYPAICGLIYLKEKRWKEAVRLVLYGLICFFFPFVFFGGAIGMQTFIENLTMLTDGFWIKLNTIGGLTNVVLYKALGIAAESSSMISFIVENIFLLLSIIFFFLAQKEWKRILFLSGILTLYVSSSYMYTSIYFLPALLVFIRECGEDVFWTWKNMYNAVMAILMATLFSLPFIMWWIFSYHDILKEAYFAIYMMLLLAFGQEFIGVWKRRRGRKVIRS